MRLLLVEDDARIARFVAKGLREQAYAVDVTANGDDALYEAAINSYDLVILDVMIPGRNGFEVCRELRRAGQRMPILMLTARDAVEDRIAGLDHGADDYLTKPFEFRELLARLRALLRRASPDTDALASGGDVLRLAGLRIDPAARQAMWADKEVRLSKTEFDLLELMVRNEGVVLEHSTVYQRIWGYDFGANSKNLAVYIGYLRRKLADAGAPSLIHTVRGVGYAARRP